MPSLPRTLEQNRAAQAWKHVMGVHAQAVTALEEELTQAYGQRAQDLRKRLDGLRSDKGAEDFKRSYGSLARSTPALIMTAGLGQALAFLRAKGKNDAASAHTWLYNHLSAWVIEQLNSTDDHRHILRNWVRSKFQMDQANGEDVDERARQALLEWIIAPEQGTDVYRRATAEALAYLRWLKRFAEAELPEPDTEMV